MEWKAGQVVITQGDPKSIVSKLIRWVTGSWWTHGFVTISTTEAVEAVVPRVKKLNIQDRMKELEAGGRDYLVMEMDGLTDEQREKIAQSALSFLGRLYDLLGCVFYVLFKSWYEGTKRVICSRLMSASYFDGIQHNIFNNVATRLPVTLEYRTRNLEDGYCTPDEVFRYSDLTVIHHEKVQMLP